MQYLELETTAHARSMTGKDTADGRERLRRLDSDDFMRALIRFAWEDLSGFSTQADAVEAMFGATWIVPEYPERLPGEVVIVPPRAPRTMASLRRVQAELRRDLERLAEGRDLFILEELCVTLQKRSPRLHFVWLIDHRGYSPDPREPLDRILYYGLGLALSRGVLARLAKCSHCGRPVMRKVEREERSGRAFCLGNACRNNFHNQNKTREERALERRITRAKG